MSDTENPGNPPSNPPPNPSGPSAPPPSAGVPGSGPIPPRAPMPPVRAKKSGGAVKLFILLVLILVAGAAIAHFVFGIGQTPSYPPRSKAPSPVVEDTMAPGDMAPGDVADEDIDLMLDAPPMPDPVMKSGELDDLAEDMSGDVLDETPAEIPDDIQALLDDVEEASQDAAQDMMDDVAVDDQIAPDEMTDQLDNIEADVESVVDEVEDVIEVLPSEDVPPEQEQAMPVEDMVEDVEDVEGMVPEQNEPISSDDMSAADPVRWPGEEAVSASVPEDDLPEQLGHEPTAAERALAQTIEAAPSGIATPSMSGVQQGVVRPLPSGYLVVKKDHDYDDIAAQLTAAKRALDRGQSDAALEIFDRLYQKTPTNTQVLMARAIALQKSGRAMEAVEAYQGVIDLDPDHVGAITNMMGLLRKEHPQIALERLLSLRESNANHPGIAAQIGITYGDLGQTKEALQYLQVASSLDPDNPSYVFNTAVIYDRMGAKTEALKYYSEALALDRGIGKVPRSAIEKRISVLR